MEEKCRHTSVCSIGIISVVSKGESVEKIKTKKYAQFIFPQQRILQKNAKNAISKIRAVFLFLFSLCHVLAQSSPIFAQKFKDMEQSNITPPKKKTERSTAKTLLQHIERIIELAENSKLDADFYKKAKTNINFVAKTMKLTESQAVIFSLFVEKSDSNDISISEIAKYAGCRTIKAIAMMGEIDELEKRRMVRCCREDKTIRYRIPREVIDALQQNKPYQYAPKENLSIDDFFEEIANLFDERYDKELTHEALVGEIKMLLADNLHLSICQQIKEMRFFEYDENAVVLLLLFCHLFVRDNDDSINFYDIERYFEKGDFRYLKSELKDADSELFDLRLIENRNDGGFEDRELFCLTNKAKTELLGELNIKENQAKNKKDMILHSTIAEKKMFYNADESKQISQLADLLAEENFKSVNQRLKNKGMRTGFACLFYGAPGTGKTETVYQIARQTGRDIFMVDISQTKSMWFGESEKRIKEIFERYRLAVKNSEIAPILLFNEADAVIGKRKDVTSGNVAQTENAIQNIILQEMENLEGIMIATTNLTQNLDKAFERRFLYKIEFCKPSLEAKQNIWQSILPDISQNDAERLATRFDFSGGQIENIARKSTVDSIISGQEPAFEVLEDYCRQEKLEKERVRIGFYS